MKKKIGSKYYYVSKTGRKLSKGYKSADSPGLKKRIREVEYYKHHPKKKK